MQEKSYHAYNNKSRFLFNDVVNVCQLMVYS